MSKFAAKEMQHKCNQMPPGFALMPLRKDRSWERGHWRLTEIQGNDFDGEYQWVDAIAYCPYCGEALDPEPPKDEPSLLPELPEGFEWRDRQFSTKWLSDQWHQRWTQGPVWAFAIHCSKQYIRAGKAIDYWRERAKNALAHCKDPQWDGTDGACIAWWRGSDHGWAAGQKERDILQAKLDEAVGLLEKLLSYTESCEGMLNCTHAGQVLNAQAFLSTLKKPCEEDCPKCR